MPMFGPYGQTKGLQVKFNGCPFLGCETEIMTADIKNLNAALLGQRAKLTEI